MIEKRGKKYRVRVSGGYTLDNKQIRHDRIADTLEEARKIEIELKALVNRAPAKVASKKMKLHDYYDYFKSNYAEKHLRLRTIETYDRFFKAIAPLIGHRAIDRIEPRDLLEMYALLEQTKKQNGTDGCLSPASIRKHHNFLHKLFAQAVRWQLILSNPCDYVDPPGSPHYENNKIILNEEETKRFLEIISNDTIKHRLWALLSIGLGLRRGELFGLQWKDIDFKSKSVSIQRTSQPRKGGGVMITPPKTKSSARIISCPTTIMGVLKEYKKEKMQERDVLQSRWQGADDPEDDFIFTSTTREGAPASPDGINLWLSRLVKSHGLPAISPHSFRHMHATFLIKEGVDVRTVAGRLGHASSVVTQTVYSHLLHSAESETAKIIDNMLK